MTQKEQRRRLGRNDFDIEDALVEEATTTVVEGAKRLNRKWPELIVTGFFGGVDVGLGILAMILIKQTTGSEVLAGMAFGIGLLAMKLAHSELFTEEFLLPLNATIAGEATVMQVVRLWSVTLVTNLLGGLAFAWLIVLALPDYHSILVDMALSYIDQPQVIVMIWFAIVIPFNMLGGLLVISLPRVIRTRRVLWAVRRGEVSLEELEEQAR